MVRACRRRYLDAAYVLNIRNEAISWLQNVDSLSRTDTTYLTETYRILCERYRSELHSPQQSLEEDYVENLTRRWTETMYDQVLPSLVGHSDFTRNVLEVAGAIPTSGYDAARQFLDRYVSEFDFPDDAPLYDFFTRNLER